MGEPAKLHSDLEALVGKLIHDRYRVDSLLGVGGMGAVFKGYHTGLKREVAIKLLHPEIGRDESVSKRFDREAYSASRLDHPNCVRVSDFGTTETGAKYLVMEFLEGAELEATLGKPWPPTEAVRVATQMFAGLEHAHHFGVVHRDLKPENVFVTTDFRGHQLVKLVDFGIAKLLDGDGAQEKLTRAGLVFGTPRYMSPEQAAGGKIDERTDLYAAGLILYEMLAGNPPFDADEPGQLLRMHIMAPPPPLPSSVPAGLVAVVDKLLEKSKGDRYSTAREVIDALDLLERELLAGPAVAAVAAAAVVGLASNSGAPPTRKTGWQPAVPTTSLPVPPPPEANVAEPIDLPAPLLAPTLPPAPLLAPTLPPASSPASGSMTMPMIAAPGPLPGSYPGTGSYPALPGTGSYPALPGTGSYPAPPVTGPHPSLSVSNASTSASQTWATSSATLTAVGVTPSLSSSASPPIERRSIVPWVIAGVALLIASLSIGVLLMGKGDPSAATEPGTGPDGAAEPPASLAPPEASAEPGSASEDPSALPPAVPNDPPERKPSESTNPSSKPNPTRPDEARKVPATQPDKKPAIDDRDAAAIEDAIDQFFNDPASDPTGKGKGKGKKDKGGKKGHH